MNEFENEQQNVPNETEKTVEQESVEPIEEINTESIFSVEDNEPKSEETAEEIEPDEPQKTERNYIPKVEITPITPSEHPADKKGIRLFAAILAAVILVSCGMTAGYFFGANNTGKPKSSSSVNLASKPKDTDEYTAAQVYDKVNESIVGIMTYNSTGASSASGVIYSNDGYIITNDHIYDGIGAAKFKVYTSDGSEYNAKYVAGDTRSDIAVLKITDDGTFKPATFGNSDELYVGENVVAIGRPSGANTANNVTSGIVSMLNRRASVTSSYSTKFIQTDSAINPGSSGGALLNMYGQVVGITSSKVAGNSYEGIGFAIPMTNVKTVAESLIKNGYVKDRAKLGISYSEITSAAAEVSNKPQGLYIATVDQSSDLNGKVNVGDIITGINGTEIKDSNIVLDVIEQSKPGDKITLTVNSNGTIKDVEAKLLPDKGSTSYSLTESNSSGTSSENNTSEFSFPFGD